MTNEALEKANYLIEEIKRAKKAKKTGLVDERCEILIKEFIPQGILEQYQSNIDAKIEKLEKELADL